MILAETVLNVSNHAVDEILVVGFSLSVNPALGSFNRLSFVEDYLDEVLDFNPWDFLAELNFYGSVLKIHDLHILEHLLFL